MYMLIDVIRPCQNLLSKHVLLIHVELYTTVMMWTCCAADKPVQKSGSLAFEVILKPATNDSPLRPVSPPKINRLTLSENDIKLKLQKAEERRQVSNSIHVQVQHNVAVTKWTVVILVERDILVLQVLMAVQQSHIM